MERQLHQILTPIRQRQRLQASLTASLWGLFVAAACGVILAGWKFAAGTPIPWQATLLLLAAGPVVGGIVGWCLQRTWQRAAFAVDQRYRLKDRTITALEFLAASEADEFRTLQVSETVSRLHSIDARQVVPFVVPKWTRWACATTAVAVALLFWPLMPKEVEAKLSQPQSIADAAQIITEELKQLQEVAEETEREDIEQLVAELQEKVEELKDPETDVREALATISEMQAELAEQLKQYNTAVVDAQMQALAQAMASAAAFEGAAKQLKEGDYQEAAEELEKLEKADMDRKESRAASEQLEKVAGAMKKAGLSSLSDAVDELSEACKDCDADKLATASKGLAGQCRSQGMRKALAQLLSNKLSRLGECKSMCQGGQCKLCGGNCKSGNCQGSKNSLAKGQSPKSDSPKNTFGMGTHGNLEGEATALDSQRSLEKITGTQGDGPSEFETTSTPEGEESARRGYRDQYGKYRKLSEAVLESEPIPLGQRQLIRNYFELIRPDRQTEQAAEQPAKTK